MDVILSTLAFALVVAAQMAAVIALSGKDVEQAFGPGQPVDATTSHRIDGDMKCDASKA